MRYASSLAPGIVLGAAWAVLWLAGRSTRPRAVVGLMAALLIADPLYRDVRLDRLLSREDTRVTARAWLDAHVAPPGPILARDSKALRWGRPALEDRYEVMRTAAIAGGGRALGPARGLPPATSVGAGHPRGAGGAGTAAVFDPYGPKARPGTTRDASVPVPA
jgi:hypothetical protein